VVIPISGVHRGMIERITAVYIELDPKASEKVRQQWNEFTAAGRWASIG